MNPTPNPEWFGARIASVFPQFHELPLVKTNIYGVPSLGDIDTITSLGSFLRAKGIITHPSPSGWGFTFHGVRYELNLLNELEAMTIAFEALFGATDAA